MNKKNGGQVPPVSDSRVLLVPVGCGKCIECRKQKSRNWQIRLKADIVTGKRKIRNINIKQRSIYRVSSRKRG